MNPLPRSLFLKLFSNEAPPPIFAVSFRILRRDRRESPLRQYWTHDRPLFYSASKRRVENSPTLSLEAVALPAKLKEHVQTYISRQNLTARQLRANASTINSVRAPESLNQKRTRNRGQPLVLLAPTYDRSQTAAFAALRMPGTYTANVFVMAEAARLLHDFAPISILDFGSGPGTSLLAASRVFSPRDAEQACSTLEHVKSLTTLSKASLVDRSSFMRSLAADLAKTDPWIERNTTVNHLSSLGECDSEETFDIVSCSYSLNEIARNALSSPTTSRARNDENRPFNREDRVQFAESEVLRTAKALWLRTAPMGLFIVIEDGTAAGFEIVSFVRDFLLKYSPALVRNQGERSPVCGKKLDKAFHSKLRPSTDLHVSAKVIAPCLHSMSCPLSGSITRHRICRFKQRLNRPSFTRTALPMPNGYEDERFSYLVVQKLVAKEQKTEVGTSLGNTAWGRLIREPLQNGKHVTLDACTREANLERRIVAKKNATKRIYSLARRAKWGDVWPFVPCGSPQRLNF